MAKRNIVLRVTADANEARRELREMGEEAKALGGIDAEINIEVKKALAERDLKQLKRELVSLSKEEATVEVNAHIENVVRKIAEVKAFLASLDEHKEIKIDVDLKRGGVERTVAGIGLMRRGILGLTGAIASVIRSIPGLGRPLAAIFEAPIRLGQAAGAAIAGLAQSLGFAGESATGFAGAMSKIGGAVGSLVGTLGTAVVGVFGLAFALQQAVQFAAALLGVLAALAASFAAAAAGAAALGVGLAAAAGPAVLGLIGIFSRLSAVMDAVKARDQAHAQTANASTSAENKRTEAVNRQRAAEQRRHEALRAVKDAMRGVQDAEQGLSDANANLREQTVAAWDAMKQAALDYKDALLGVESATLGIADAKLSLQEARLELEKFNAEQRRGAGGGAGVKGPASRIVRRTGLEDTVQTPPQAAANRRSALEEREIALRRQRLALTVRQSEFGIKQAYNQRAHALFDLNKAERTHNQFLQQGIRAYGPYRDAIRQVQDAEQRLRDAHERLDEAQRKLRQGTAETATTAAAAPAAFQKLDQAMGKLTPTELALMRNLLRLRTVFTGLARTVSQPVFAAFNRQLGRTHGFMRPLEQAARRLGRAFASVVNALFRFARERASRKAFQEITDASAKLIRLLGSRVFIDFLRIMRNIARDVMPLLVARIRKVADWFHKLAHGSGTRDFRRTINTIVKHFDTWWGIAKEVGRIVLSFFRAAAPEGKKLADHILRVLRRFRAWLDTKEGQRAIRRFLRNAVQTAKDLWNVFVDLIKIINDVATAASNAWKKLKPLVDAIKFLNASGGVGGALSKLPGSGTLFGGQEGGFIPGSGRGDIVPAMLEPGEFVVKRSIVKSLGLPALQALNGGGQVQTMAAPQQWSRGTVIENLNVSVPGGGSPDPEVLGVKAMRAIERRGGYLGKP